MLGPISAARVGAGIGSCCVVEQTALREARAAACQLLHHLDGERVAPLLQSADRRQFAMIGVDAQKAFPAVITIPRRGESRSRVDFGERRSSYG
jgi:hypothetical protein